MRIYGIPIGWSPYSSMHSSGFVGDDNPVPRATAFDLIRHAKAWGLAGVEIPYPHCLSDDGKNLSDAVYDEIAKMARDHGLFVNVAANGYTVDSLRGPLEAAARIGAKVVRTVVGGSAMGGDRRPQKGKWKEHVDRAAQGLAGVMEIAEPLGLRVGVENHQDLSSEDLLYIIDRVESPLLGITFDVGNALSTVELPTDWARELASHIVDIHIKDYRVQQTPSGYRLVRCPIGRGVVDFDAVLAEIAKSGRDVPAVIELGAVYARSVPCLEPDYWDDYPPRSARMLARVLGFVSRHAMPASWEWRTPRERGASIDEILAWERAEFEESLECLRRLAREGETGAT